jgi:aryl-alcohol dehydrogenase-like predicted oxidoreductase
VKYLTLTKTDLRVSRICLGTGSLGKVVPRDESFEIMDAFVEAGGTFFDSAHYYANWIPGEKHSSEKTVGAWLKRTGGRGNLVIATKGGHPEFEQLDVPRLSPRDIVGDLDSSLDLLGLDSIDLYWLHRDDPGRPVGEIIETLGEQVQLGKIHYLGCSNWKPSRIREANAYATARGLRPFVASQIFWSLAVPNPGTVKWDQAELDDEAEAFYLTAGMSVHAFTSQAKGFFAKANLAGIESLKPALRHSFDNVQTRGRLRRAQDLAEQLGTTVSAVVLAWITSSPLGGIPVIGSLSLENLADSLTDVDLTLTPAKLQYLRDGT